MGKLQVYKKYFETASDDTRLVMHRGYAIALVNMVEQLEKEKSELLCELGRSDTKLLNIKQIINE